MATQDHTQIAGELKTQYTIVVSYRADWTNQPQWKEFSGADKEEVRGEFEEFAIFNHVFSAEEVAA